MEIGIIGLPVSGKSTIFSTLTQHQVEQFSGKIEAHRGVVKVPDNRLDQLTEIFNPKKQVNATIEYVEVPGLEKDAAKSGFNSTFLTNLKNTDAIMMVVRAFEDEMFPHPEGEVDAARDLEIVDSEMLFSDLTVIENRLERLKKQLMKQKNKENEEELKLIERCKQILEDEKPLRSAEFSETELKKLRGYQFLTLKPIIYVININEDDISKEETILEQFSFLKERAKTSIVVLSAKIEQELSTLEEEEKTMFMEDLGIKEPALPKLIRASYELLDLISFFTVGDDECRAWTIRKGTNAQKAAGTIHSDLERGFIRAEVIHYDEFMKYKSLPKCKEAGVLRLEGKEYIVKDGDIISVRFNV
ncbi:MAG: redox-regulated ATPase YchF [Calditrichia bacterium]